MKVFSVFILTISLILSACTKSPKLNDVYNPKIDPVNFTKSTDLTNSYFPLTLGMKFIYEGETDDGVERVEIERLATTREIMGITSVVVQDTVYLDGKLIEYTRDWFAQDNEGIVWYLGEAVDNYDPKSGEIRDHSGSWEAGVDGAKPGIVMLKKPEVGRSYRQEYYPGHAEDQAEVVELGLTIETPAGVFENVIKTRDWTELEPDVIEFKYYAPGVGVIKEVNEKDKEEIVLIKMYSN